MIIISFLFWVLFSIIVYAYFGYGAILAIIIWIRKLIGYKPFKVSRKNEGDLPEVTLFVAAFNEKDFLETKMENSLSLNYPQEKIRHIWVTDGSDDGTPELLKKYEQVIVLHEQKRSGKIAAMNRGMAFVKTPIVIFSDGNTTLGPDAIRTIVDLFENPLVGCVAGEKRIISNDLDSAAGSGEGLYWKYESLIKRLDASLHSVIGAAGELFAIRTDLFLKVENDTILDDFIISMRIAKQGYTVQYHSDAYAIETASANVKEEMKRKVRIAAGGIQSIGRLKELLNPFQYGVLSFQYISHKVLRWTAVPLAILLLFPLNFMLAFEEGFLSGHLYSFLFWGQVSFYSLSLLGWIVENKKLKMKWLFAPYYLFIMNYAVFLGFLRFVRGRQSVNWERARRG